MDAAGSPKLMPLAWLALLVLCGCVFLCTTPGRITYPDDEIVFQTTQSMVEDHDVVIPGIAKRTGERADRPTGTFGWGPGREGQRYGFFGQALSVVAIPFYAVADATVERVPELWRYALRSDLFTFHQRDLEADWVRLVVSLTNCLLTPLAAVLLGVWLQALGHGARVSLATAAIYALATTAWPYSRTFLSEPLSALVLLGAALEITRWHHDGRAQHLWLAAALSGLSVHVHVLNLLAIPCLFAYALGARARAGSWTRSLTEHRRVWIIAALLCGSGLALLGVSQWWRFGSPFETGRFDDYGHWVWPFEALLTIAIAPGRSLLLYSPPLLLALWAWPALRRRDRATATFVLALTLTRLLFVACRSDWHGGWAIGPRYLVPIVPFLLVPLAGWLESWPSRSALQRGLASALFVGSASLQAWLAVHSVFQIYWQLNREHGRERYMYVSDWSLSAMPPVAFWQQQQAAWEFWRAGQHRAAWMSAQFDMLGFGAWRLSKLTPADGLWMILLGIMVLAALAFAVLAWWWRRASGVHELAALRYSRLVATTSRWVASLLLFASCFADPGNPEGGDGESSTDTESESGESSGDGDGDGDGDPTGDGECVPMPPSGWAGPVALALGSSPDALACEAAWPDEHPLAGVGDPGGSVTCDPCGCGAAGGASCPASAPFERHVNDSTCSNAIGVMYDSTVQCQTAMFGVGGNMLGLPPTPIPGTCPVAGGEVSSMMPAFPQFAKVCGPEPTAEPCPDGVAVPGFEMPADWATCIWQEGNLPTCPPGSDYSSGPFVIADEFEDTRDCAACSCTEPTEVQCSVYRTLAFQVADCVGAAGNIIVHDGLCQATSTTLASWRLDQAPSVVNEGSCLASGGESIGSVEITHQLTLCCL